MALFDPKSINDETDKYLAEQLLESDELLRDKWTRAFLGFSSNEFYKAKQDPTFPKKKFIPFRGIGYDVHELKEWAEGRANR